MSDDTPELIGQRIKQIRKRRRLTQQVVAELAGISAPYLSMIESGQRPVERRATLEALANALRVSPVDLGALPVGGPATDPELGEALAGVPAVEDVLTDLPVFEASVTPRPWAQVRSDVAHLVSVLRPAADLPGQVRVIPGLLRELNAVAATDRSREVLAALAQTYHATSLVTKYLGARALPGVAVMHLRTVAQELDEPRYLGLAQFARSQSLAAGGRERSRALAVATADELQPRIGSDDDARQVYGMAHLNAALASAALGDAPAAADHLGEARDAADASPDNDDPGFGHLSFTSTNVAFWEVAVTLELGDHGKVVQELRPRVHPDRMASRSRRGAYWADIGRSLAQDRATRDEAVAALMTAEELSPVATRANVWVRETVADLVYRSRRDAVSADLRGLAYRVRAAS